jgi:hypothetical protein
MEEGTDLHLKAGVLQAGAEAVEQRLAAGQDVFQAAHKVQMVPPLHGGKFAGVKTLIGGSHCGPANLRA